MSYRLPSVMMPAARSMSSTFSEPGSVRWTVFIFSSFSYASVSRTSSRITSSTVRYMSELSSDGPLMISGVRASSIRMLSTSSTIA